MNPLIIPLLAAVAQAASLIDAKIGITKRHISLRDYIPGLFLFLTITALISLIKLGDVNYSIVSERANLLRLFLIILVAAIWNVLFYKGVSKEKANTAEGIMVIMPLATIAISWLFIPENFSLPILVIGVSATALVAWAYSAHGRLYKIDKYALMLAAAVVLIGFENVLVSQLLSSNALSPASLYALRATVLFVLFYCIYRPRFSRVSKKHFSFLAISGVLGTTGMLLRFYGLKEAGVVATSLMLILSPIIVLYFARHFLHEKVKKQRVYAMAFVLVLIVMATILNYKNI